MTGVMSGLAALLADIALWGGLAIVVFGGAKLVFVPLAMVFELRAIRRRRRGHRSLLDAAPSVTVIVPAYNEGPVLANCLRSLLASDYPRLEVVVVDDGSTDDTATVMCAFAAADARVSALSQANSGKGAALNRGIGHAGGEVLLFVDADGIFAPTTIREMLLGFDHPLVGAVCGDDRPVNLNRAQTHLLAIMNHVGTGMVRRALVMLQCLPIVSGNIGAFPRAVIAEVGGFRTDTVGEDLELTWRVHRAGYRVNFQPRALVYAEAPSTVVALWRQRLRWARGLLQTMRIHARVIGNPRYGPFGVYLIVNAATMVLMPVVQLLVLACLPLAVTTGRVTFHGDVMSVLGWVGLWVSLGLVVFASGLNRAWRDLRFVWSLILWPIYSLMMCAVMLAALIAEVEGQPASWNKMTRSGVVSDDQSRHYAGLKT